MKLSIEGLQVHIDKEAILHNISLQVEQGEFLSLQGPSGCGKSTLLKSIAGILPAEQGTIYLDGKDITRLPIHQRGTVIVFQDMRLFPNMTVEENIAFPLKMQKVPKAQRLSAARELLEKVQLPGYGKRRIHQLSGGQQQRVALARALAAKPKLLLLDEPFSALDEELRQGMRELVLQLHKEFAMTTIMVTHDRPEAVAMSDRIITMSEGAIVDILRK